MKIYNIQNQQNFKGYKNVLSHSFKTDDGFSLGFMAMKLDNEGGYRDLEAWQNIQRVLNPKAEPYDYILFQNADIFGKDGLMVNNFLLDINNEFSKKEISKERESMMIKANSLVASLTKRIMNTENHPEDGLLYKTLVFAHEKLKPIYGEKGANEFLTYQAVMKRVKHNITAKLINDGISRNMAKFFKA